MADAPEGGWNAWSDGLYGFVPWSYGGRRQHGNLNVQASHVDDGQQMKNGSREPTGELSELGAAAGSSRLSIHALALAEVKHRLSVLRGKLVLRPRHIEQLRK